MAWGVGRRAWGVGRRASGLGRRASGVGRRASVADWGNLVYPQENFDECDGYPCLGTHGLGTHGLQGLPRLSARLRMGDSYRDLRVWQRAMELVVAVYESTQSFPKAELFGLVSQMRRAVVSIRLNSKQYRRRQGKDHRSGPISLLFSGTRIAIGTRNANPDRPAVAVFDRGPCSCINGGLVENGPDAELADSLDQTRGKGELPCGTSDEYSPNSNVRQLAPGT
jgi:hypothetical protein